MTAEQYYSQAQTIPLCAKIGFIQLVGKDNDNFFIQKQGDSLNLVSSFLQASLFIEQKEQDLENLTQQTKIKYPDLIVLGRYFIVEQPENIKLNNQ